MESRGLWGKCKATAPEGSGCLLLGTVAHAGYKVCGFQVVPEGSYIEEGRVKEKLPALPFETAALGTGFLREQFRVVWGHAVTSDSWGAEMSTKLRFALAYLNI